MNEGYIVQSSMCPKGTWNREMVIEERGLHNYEEGFIHVTIHVTIIEGPYIRVELEQLILG